MHCRIAFPKFESKELTKEIVVKSVRDVDVIEICYKDGIIGSITHYYNGIKHGRKIDYLNGMLHREMWYLHDKLEGEYREYGNEIMQCNYKDGLKDGVEIVKYKDGNIKIKCNYVEGNLDGGYTEYYENKNIKVAANYKYNQIHGPRIVYYDNHITNEYAEYVNGIKYGIYYTHNKFGKCIIEANFKMDELDGEYKEYNDNGDLIVHKIYNCGTLVKTILPIQSAIDKLAYNSNRHMNSVITCSYGIMMTEEKEEPKTILNFIKAKNETEPSAPVLQFPVIPDYEEIEEGSTKKLQDA